MKQNIHDTSLSSWIVVINLIILQQQMENLLMTAPTLVNHGV